MRRFGQRPATAPTLRRREERPKAKRRAGGARVASARDADRLRATTVPATVAGAPHSPRFHRPRSEPRQFGCCKSQSLLLLRCRNADRARAVHDDDAVNWMAFVDDDAVNDRTVAEMAIMEDDPMNCVLVHMVGRAPRRALSQQTRQRRRSGNADLPHENLLGRDGSTAIPRTGAVYNFKSSRFLLRRQSPFSEKSCCGGAPVGAAAWIGPGGSGGAILR